MSAHPVVRFVPVAGNAAVKAGGAEVNVIPAVDPAEILSLLGSAVVFVLFLVCSEIQPAGSPCLIVTASGAVVETGTAISSNLIILS